MCACFFCVRAAGAHRRQHAPGSSLKRRGKGNQQDGRQNYVHARVATSIDALAGGVFGTKYKTKAEAAGGVILILIGVKILLEHFGIL